MELQDLVGTLKWSTDSSIAGPWKAEYLEALDHRLARLCSIDVAGAELAKAFGLLSARQKAEILSYPFIADRLRRTGVAFRHQTFQVLADALSEILSGKLLLPASLRLCLPATGSNLIVDFDTPLQIAKRGEADPGLRLVAQSSQRDLIRAKLHEAIEILTHHVVTALHFTGSFIYLVCIREEVEARASFSSVSFSCYPGLAVLSNCHVPGVGAHKLADALVHEAIHGALYLFETTKHPLLTCQPPADLQLQSPWTGRQLSLDAYVQACFVWFGLAHLWKQMVSSADEIGEATTLLRKALSGFRLAPISGGNRATLNEFCAPDTFTCLQELEHELRMVNL
jgi:HEXXH motif-containing protein